jgi:lipopolysaccharide transport system permease protein
MLVFAIFFGRLAKIPSDGIPYPLFSLAALIPWQFFASALAQSSNSIVAEKQLITRIYFPRLIVPLAAVLSTLVDLLVALVLLAVAMAYYRVVPGLAIVALPGLILLALLAALGVGLWLSALNVSYRDFRYTIPFLVQFWLFASPVAYPSSLVPAQWRALYALNPMVGVVDGFRWALLNGPAPELSVFGASALAVLTLTVTGGYFFRRMERSFADLV